MEQKTVELRAARFSDRVVAYLLDTVPFGLGAVASVWLWTGPLGRVPSLEVLSAISAGWMTLALGVQLVGNLTGATPGKRLMGLRVLRRDGTSLGFGRALARALFWGLGQTAAHAGFLVALCNRENRALHDYVAGTVVIEAYRKSRSEGAALFLAAALSAIGIFSFQLWRGWSAPTEADRLAVARAEEGLFIFAETQDAHFARTGRYAANVAELADASGDAAVFIQALSEIYQPQLSLEGGNRGWRVKVRAKDRRKTLLTASGP